ncbi:MAG: chemotaxis protein CheB [Burkholderiaceae bacterium]|nr:chemotaxis protein CheB [Burkholderiaceae bacterium]
MYDRTPDPSAYNRDTVVIGASAGGIQALRTIVRELPSPFPAAILIVLHIGNHPSALAAILHASGPLPVIQPRDGEVVRPGHIYVAVPDRHMLLEYDRVRLSRGPRENHTRPAIDPLFRSAALTRGPRVIGTLLTGRLDDGVAGLQAIKECGGLAVVQDPASAEEPSMPSNALRSVAVDRVVPLGSLAETLAELAGEPATRAGAPAIVSQQPAAAADQRPATAADQLATVPTRSAAVPKEPAKDAPVAERVPVHLSREHAIALGEGDVVGELDSMGRPSRYSCPECGGTMWQIDAPGPTRFRCHTGHAYAMRSLLGAQSTRVEQALWEAARALREKAMMLRQVAQLDRRAGDAPGADASDRRAQQYDEQARVLRDLIRNGAGIGPKTGAAAMGQAADRQEFR